MLKGSQRKERIYYAGFLEACKNREKSHFFSLDEPWEVFMYGLKMVKMAPFEAFCCYETARIISVLNVRRYVLKKLLKIISKKYQQKVGFPLGSFLINGL